MEDIEFIKKLIEKRMNIVFTNARVSNVTFLDMSSTEEYLMFDVTATSYFKNPKPEKHIYTVVLDNEGDLSVIEVDSESLTTCISLL